jgi:hypothetical protein
MHSARRGYELTGTWPKLSTPQARSLRPENLSTAQRLVVFSGVWRSCALVPVPNRQRLLRTTVALGAISLGAIPLGELEPSLAKCENMAINSTGVAPLVKKTLAAALRNPDEHAATMGGLTLKDAFNILSITKARDNDKVEPEGLVKATRAKQRSRHDRGIGRGLRSSAGSQSGQPSTAHEHLTMFYDTPEAKTFVELMQAANSARKTRSTYIDGFLEDLRPGNLLHPTCMLFKGGMYDAGGDDDDSGTVTGRTAFKTPAVQTVPKHTYWAKKLRKAYIAPPGKLVWARDFKQGELKVIASVAGEEKMISVYKPGSEMNTMTKGDLHALTGAKFAGVDEAAKFFAWQYVEEKKAEFGKFRQHGKHGKHEANFPANSSWQTLKLQACGV